MPFLDCNEVNNRWLKSWIDCTYDYDDCRATRQTLYDEVLLFLAEGVIDTRCTNRNIFFVSLDLPVCQLISPGKMLSCVPPRCLSDLTKLSKNSTNSSSVSPGSSSGCGFFAGFFFLVPFFVPCRRDRLVETTGCRDRLLEGSWNRSATCAPG